MTVKVSNWWLPDRDRLAKSEWRLTRTIELYNRMAVLVKANLRYKDLYIDIGANFGMMTVPFVNTFEQIYSFEMCPSNYDALIRNTSKYNNVYTFNVGLSNKSEKVDVIEYPTAGAVNAIVETKLSRGEPGEIVQRNVVQLDEMLPYETAGFIKIDVEGHEVQVIEGGQELISRSRGLCMIESISTRQKVKQMMSDLGWVCTGRWGPDDLIFKKYKVTI
jgi:FkbM family methyltransferase